MTSQKIVQGTILSVGAGAISSGVAFVTNLDYITGVLLIAIGFGLVYWRETRK